MAELAYAAASRAALLWVQIPPGLPEFLDIFVGEWAGRLGTCLLNKGSRKRLAGSTPALSAITEGTAEWPATGPENQGMVMSHGRSIRLPSSKTCGGA